MPESRDVKRLVRASVVLYVINAFLIVLVGTTLYLQQVEAKRDLQRRAANGQAYRYQACRGTEDLKTIIRDTIAENIINSEQFLKDNPKGIPGIPKQLILDGIAKNERTVQKLEPIDCLKVAQG